ncbi:uncharacterized protein [Ptychodera flava]|uniref:uncharacterized protein n=1 Tax=Ptychodera flava TaxID=63121 RepID=UPI00396A871E
MLYIHFHSDKSSRYEGFYAVYDTKTNQDGSPSYYVCSDDSVHELGGLIYSHEDYPASYPELMTCVLTIFASAVYEKIYLKFVDVDLYHPLHVGCGSFDVIRVAEGDGEELGTICQDGDTDDYITASGSMVITFNAKDNTLNSDVRGFKAIFTAFYDTTYSWEDCSIDTDFHCNNRRCIYGKLRCDGYDNCGDNSDEENCVSSEVASVVGTSVGIIFVLVVIIIIVCICKRACSPTPAGRRSRGRPKRATTQPPPVNYSQGQVNVTPNPPQATYYGNAPPYPSGVQQNPAGYRQPAGYNPVIVPGPTYPQGPQQASPYPAGPQRAQLYPTDQPYRAPTPVQDANDPAYPPPPAAYAPAFPQQPAPETLSPPSVPPPSYEEVTSASHGDNR